MDWDLLLSMLGIYGSYRLHVFESMLYNLTHEWMFSDSLPPGPLARSLGFYALRLRDRLKNARPTHTSLPSLVPSPLTHSLHKKRDGRRNQVEDRMVGQSRNLKGSGPNGGDQAPPEGEQIQPDPAAILYSIPPPSYAIHLALECLHTDDAITATCRLRSSRRLVRSFGLFTIHSCLSRRSKTSTLVHRVVFGVMWGDRTEGQHSREAG